MKLRSTTPIVSKSFLSQSTLVAASVLVAAAGFIQLGSAVFARNYDAEIQAKEQEAQQYQGQADKLGQMADTLQGEVDRLNGQISSIREQIAKSQAKHNELVAQIEANEALIKQNREALGDILSDIYVDDQISPLEMLASSKSIGDYIDKQEQRTSLRGALNEKIKDIKTLQKKLEEDRKSVENVLQDQESQRSQLASTQAEQQKLLTDTQSDQNKYSSLVATRNAEVSKLREQQAAANRQANNAAGINVPGGIAGGGGYPGVWANAPLDAYVDPWGLYTRECVSYVAWKIHSTGRFVPHFGGQGNANQWPATTARYGISSGSTPRAGAAAVWYIGYYGHVMYVESVNGDGTITVSDYNLEWDGLYRKYDRPASGLTYIYF